MNNGNKEIRPGNYLAETCLEFGTALPEPLGVPLLVGMAVVFGMWWFLRWLIDEMVSRG